MSDIDDLRRAASEVDTWGRLYLNAPGEDAREVDDLDSLVEWLRVSAQRTVEGSPVCPYALAFAGAVLLRAVAE